MIVVWVVLGIVVLGAGFFVNIYNRLIKARNMVKEGWSGIEVQLKRRANLIPNLVDTVKGYAAHEKGVFQQVTELRDLSAKASGPAEAGVVEGQLSMALGRLLAVAEAYPDLKANQNFLDLQKNLADLEDQIQMARRYYNGTAREMNILVESFPSNIVAGMFNFQLAEFFEVEDPAERAVPKVSFS